MNLFGHYTLSQLGIVRSKRTGRPVRTFRSDSGYVTVVLFDASDRRRKFQVHKLVLESFVGPAPTPRHRAAHLDGVQTNNRLSNLAWKTPEENEADKKRHGTVRGGGPKVATPAEAVQRIRQAHQQGCSLSFIARAEGMHRTSVARIVQGLRRAS